MRRLRREDAHYSRYSVLLLAVRVEGKAPVGIAERVVGDAGVERRMGTGQRGLEGMVRLGVEGVLGRWDAEAGLVLGS